MPTGIIKEIALITAIVSDAYTSAVYEQHGKGYFEALEVITKVSIKIYKRFERVIMNQALITDNWQPTYDEYNVDCYDDLIVKVAGKMLWEDYELNVEPR